MPVKSIILYIYGFSSSRNCCSNHNIF
jgi:hypothetical protein